MALGIVFFRDCGGFEEVKWSQVGIKIGRKSNVNLEKRFSENRTPAAAGARFFKFKGSKLGPKINQKTFKKWDQDGKASWHRFLSDFGGFGAKFGAKLEASWPSKSMANQSKNAWTFPHRSGDVPVGSRGRNTEFSMVWRGGPWRCAGFRSLKK